MFNKSRVPCIVAGLFLAVSITSCITASDSVPTFNLKNKSESGSIILVVHPRDDESIKHMRISQDGRIAYEGP